MVGTNITFSSSLVVLVSSNLLLPLLSFLLGYAWNKKKSPAPGITIVNLFAILYFPGLAAAAAIISVCEKKYINSYQLS